MPDYIFDTTVLSNFAAVGQFSLLRQHYRGCAFTTWEVHDELRQGLKAGYAYLAPVVEDLQIPAGWVRIVQIQSAEGHRLRVELEDFLGIGEASCLVLARLQRLILVTDDLAARRFAKDWSVTVTGTLGILIRLVRDGHLMLADANALLSDMIARRYRSPVDRLDSLI